MKRFIAVWILVSAGLNMANGQDSRFGRKEADGYL